MAKRQQSQQDRKQRPANACGQLNKVDVREVRREIANVLPNRTNYADLRKIAHRNVTKTLEGVTLPEDLNARSDFIREAARAGALRVFDEWTAFREGFKAYRAVARRTIRACLADPGDLHLVSQLASGVGGRLYFEHPPLAAGTETLALVEQLATETAEIANAIIRYNLGSTDEEKARAFERLWTLMEPRIMQTLSRMCPEGCLEDVKHNAFLRLRTAKLNPGRVAGAWTGYLRQTAVNLAFDYFRQNGRYVVEADLGVDVRGQSRFQNMLGPVNPFDAIEREGVTRTATKDAIKDVVDAASAPHHALMLLWTLLLGVKPQELVRGGYMKLSLKNLAIAFRFMFEGEYVTPQDMKEILQPFIDRLDLPLGTTIHPNTLRCNPRLAGAHAADTCLGDYLGKNDNLSHWSGAILRRLRNRYRRG